MSLMIILIFIFGLTYYSTLTLDYKMFSSFLILTPTYKLIYVIILIAIIFIIGLYWNDKKNWGIILIIQGTETLTSLIHIISESLLTPVVIILVISVVIVILAAGGTINEKLKRKPIKSNEFESLVRDISFCKTPSEIEEKVSASNLFDFQKDVLIKIAKNHDIGSKARKALASELISSEETRLIKSTNKTDILIRLSPILGLLGTLIPLGPGLAALGSGDITTLAQSLTIAFDTTVTGLAVGGVAYLISKYKKQWYESDLINLETLAEVELEILDKIGG